MYNIIEVNNEQENSKISFYENLTPQTKLAISVLQNYGLKLIFASSEAYITPFSIIAVSTSAREIDAITSNIFKSIKEQSLFTTSIKIDGNGERGWCIIDFINCLTHIITQEKMNEYKLEEIFKQKIQN